MKLPVDRGHLQTEGRDQRSAALDAMSVGECVQLMVEDHHAVQEAVHAAAAALECFIEAMCPRVADGGRLIYVGAGTSGRLGVMDASECPPTFQSDPGLVVGLIAGGDAALRRSSEAREDDEQGAARALRDLEVEERDTLLGIAAGGTTPYVRGAIAMAGAAGLLTGLITCVDLDKPPRGCDHLIHLPTGPELLTGSTRLKAGSATKLALNIISTTMFVQLGKVYSNLMVDLRATNDKLLDRAIRVLMALDPSLSRGNAAVALSHADGNVKVAIVMQRLGVAKDVAERKLAACGGRLRAILDDG